MFRLFYTNVDLSILILNYDSLFLGSYYFFDSYVHIGVFLYQFFSFLGSKDVEGDFDENLGELYALNK